MYYWIDSENYSCTIDYPLGSICVLLCKYLCHHCHVGTLSTKAVPYTVVKVGGGIDSATEVTHFGLN